jgi:hypothetical protein
VDTGYDPHHPRRSAGHATSHRGQQTASRTRATHKTVARTTRKTVASVPYVRDEVLTRVTAGTTSQALATLGRRYRLVELERQTLQLTGFTLVRWRIKSGRSVPAVVRSVNGSHLALAQPNYIFSLQEDPAPHEGEAAS